MRISKTETISFERKGNICNIDTFHSIYNMLCVIVYRNDEGNSKTVQLFKTLAIDHKGFFLVIMFTPNKNDPMQLY